MSAYDAKALWQMINFDSVFLSYKGLCAHCSWKQIVVSLGIQRLEVQVEAKLWWLPSEDLDEKRVKKFVSPKHISQMITQVCVLQLGTFSASDATLSTSELGKLYHDTVQWVGNVTPPYTGIMCYTWHPDHLLSILFYVYFATWLQICFRCRTSTLFTSPVTHSWIPVFHSL